MSEDLDHERKIKIVNTLASFLSRVIHDFFPEAKSIMVLTTRDSQDTPTTTRVVISENPTYVGEIKI